MRRKLTLSGVLAMLLVCLAVSGCANNDDRSDQNQNRFGGFYGGINGGIATGTDGR